jgi:hypothetical protein
MDVFVCSSHVENSGKVHIECARFHPLQAICEVGEFCMLTKVCDKYQDTRYMTLRAIVRLLDTVGGEYNKVKVDSYSIAAAL